MINKDYLHDVVFGTESKAGKRFDVVLLWVILFSVFIVMIESIPEVGLKYNHQFFVIEWILTIIFTLEFILRIFISPKPIKYILSFWGFIDLLSILPTYLSFFITGYHYLLVVRVFRLLRIFRILKLVRFNNEALKLTNALKSSMHKIAIFLISVITVVTFMGTLMYVVEGGKDGFTSIPQSIYWAIVTVTTVGYGDMVPHTVIGKFISSIAMITGYAIIAVPTGIVTVELSKQRDNKKQCKKCDTAIETNVNYCSNCGEKQ